MEPLIKFENVCYTYTGNDAEPGMFAVHDLSLEIKEGEFVAILGHNGSGKSTTAKLMNMILAPNSGDIYVEGNKITGRELTDEDVFEVRKKIGMVFQNPDNQIVSSIVEEDVAFALENLGVPYEEMRKIVDDALRDVRMYDFRMHSPSQLSGGQKQRVAIAGIIAMRPKCIILDEPTAMLDPQGRREVMATVKRLNRDYGTTIVLITHFMDEAAACGRVVVMEKGKAILDGTPEEVFAHVELLKKMRLDVPQVTELVHELRKEGFELPADIITEEECVEALMKLFGKA